MIASSAALAEDLSFSPAITVALTAPCKLSTVIF